LNRRYGDRVAFLAVYLREAHPSDGWGTASAVKQPRTAEERTAVAGTCRSALKMTIPLVVDDLDDHVGHAYSGMPDRLYVIDRNGTVAYKGGRGPFGFKPGEMEQSLAMLLLDDGAAPKAGANVPIPDDAEAWKHLPPAERGAGQPLPAWARALARPLPATAAAMLDLDRLHRAGGFLEPKLRAKMRWVAARANRSPYGEAQAAADLRRAGATNDEIAALAGDPAVLPPDERLPLVFARKMTFAAHSVTDAEVAELIRRHGEKEVVAMVLLLAYANFQDRLVLALGLPPEADPPPALDVKFRRGEPAGVPAPPRKELASAGPPAAATVPDPEWTVFDFAALQKNLQAQRDRPGRIRVPTWEEVAKTLPAGETPHRPVRIKWSLVCSGYQPQLAAGWSACTRAFRKEANQDRVFEESLFWVVTRSLQCFY
jgi:alkylhydroperoxidase family enzyme